MKTRKIFAGIFLLTLAVLMLELALTRLFSATMYYHFAFLAISLALFGGGASGVFIYVVQDKLKPEKTQFWLSTFSLLFAIGVVMALLVILNTPLSLIGGADNYIRLIKIYAATFVPFFLAGCAVSLAITRLAGDINRLYLYDLAGAALGCLLLIPFLNIAGAINVIIFVAIFGALASLVFSFDRQGVKIAAASVLLTAILAGLAFYNGSSNIISINISKGEEEANLLYSKWNSFSRITVQETLQKDLEISIDADASTKILKDGPNTAVHQNLKDDISALAYHIKPDANVAIIGPGGGTDVGTALVFGARRIVGIEINPIIARDVMLSEPFLGYSGNLYRHPKLELHVEEGRSFIRRTDERFDILQGTMVDTWAATGAGAFSLSENNLYTVEAFKDYALHLSDDGLLTMTRWYFEPPDQLLRLVSLSRAMMQELKIANPERHFILARDAREGADKSPATFIFKRSEFTDNEIRLIESVAATNGFELLYTPLTQPDNAFTRMIRAADPKTVWDGFVTDVAPTYDNNPFFFNSLRLTDLSKAFSISGEWRKTNLGSFVLFALLIITSILVVLFIALPLALTRKRVKSEENIGRLPYLLYFGCLGTGFIVVEIAMIQKFILFLGHPVYSLSVILFSLLLFCSLGSYASRYFGETTLTRSLVKMLVLVAIITGLYILLLPTIFYTLVWLPLVYRILISVALMFPLAFVMGMPLPIGIRLLSKRAPAIIPWVWGVNGATSVMGSVATLVIAIFTGFNQALVIGAAIYLVGAFFITRANEDRAAET